MSLQQWAKDSRVYLEQKSAPVALRAATQEFWQGITNRIGRYCSGTSIWQMEWDVLCILDGCRVDLMNEVMNSSNISYLPQNCGQLRSVGTMSPEWLGRTFSSEFDEEISKTGYITGNPWTAEKDTEWTALPLVQSRFAYLAELWQDEWGKIDSFDISTVPPRPLTNSAISLWRDRETYGMNKLIVHYMQPHEPFPSRPEWFEEQTKEIETNGGSEGNMKTSIWHRYRDGEINRQDLWSAYRDTLLWVLEDIEILQKNCTANIVLSSDHGNGMGEWGVYGHPDRSPVPVIRNVPWVEIEGIDTETHMPKVNLSDQSISQQSKSKLADLGYL